MATPVAIFASMAADSQDRARQFLTRLQAVILNLGEATLRQQPGGLRPARLGDVPQVAPSTGGAAWLLPVRLQRLGEQERGGARPPTAGVQPGPQVPVSLPVARIDHL